MARTTIKSTYAHQPGKVEIDPTMMDASQGGGRGVYLIVSQGHAFSADLEVVTRVSLRDLLQGLADATGLEIVARKTEPPRERVVLEETVYTPKGN